MVKNDPSVEILNIVPHKTTRPAGSVIYHVPETASFENWDGHNYPTRISKEIILQNISSSIDKYGYAVVTMHPETFSEFEKTNSFTDILDKAQINELNGIIDYLVSESIRIINFADLTGMR